MYVCNTDVLIKQMNQNGSKTCPVPLQDICPLYSDCEICKTAGCNWTKDGCQKEKTTESMFYSFCCQRVGKTGEAVR